MIACIARGYVSYVAYSFETYVGYAILPYIRERFIVVFSFLPP